MPIVLPTNTPSPSKKVKGAARIFAANFLAFGAAGWPDPPASGNGALAYLGQLADGGATVEGGPEYVNLEGEESLGPVDAFIQAESHKISATLLEAPIETLALVLGNKMITNVTAGVSDMTSANVVSTPSDNTMGIGGIFDGISTCPTFYNVVMEVPVESGDPLAPCAAGLTGILQFWKCLIKSTGGVTYTRKGFATVPIEIEAFWDEEVVPSIGAYGHFGRRIHQK